MSTMGNVEARVPLAGPPRYQGSVSVVRFLKGVRRNGIAVWPDEAYESDVLRLRVLMRNVLVVNSPVMLKHILLDRIDNYRKSPIQRRVLGPLIGDGLLMSEGELWRRHRRTIAPIFRPQRIARFTDAMAIATHEMLGNWARSPKEPMDMASAMTALTLTIIARVMLSTEPDSDMQAIVASIPEYQRNVRPHLFDLVGLPKWIPRVDWDGTGSKVEATCGVLNRTIDRIVERRKAAREMPDDLLSLLLNARDEETQQPMNAREIRDEVANIFLAGHDTTAHALTWVWYLLALHPREEEALHAELDAVLGDAPPKAADIERLPRARMILEEAMRLYPPAHTLSRFTVDDDEVLGHHIPKGATVIISPWLLHRHRRLWKDPDVFDPDRFSPEQVGARHRFAYIPFGAGPRICIGAPFAMAEGVMILASIAQRYRLRLVPGSTVEPVGLITLRPRDGLPMYLEPRK
jgi:cytochrome P450